MGFAEMVFQQTHPSHTVIRKVNILKYDIKCGRCVPQIIEFCQMVGK